MARLSRRRPHSRRAGTFSAMSSIRMTEDEYREQAAKRTRWQRASEVVDTGAPAASEVYPFVGMCQRAGLPVPRPEFTFHPTRKWRFDYAWQKHLLALEVEGGIWTQGRHTRGSGALADMEKYSEAAILGWRLLYVTPDQVRNGAALAMIGRALIPTLEAA